MTYLTPLRDVIEIHNDSSIVFVNPLIILDTSDLTSQSQRDILYKCRQEFSSTFGESARVTKECFYLLKETLEDTAHSEIYEWVTPSILLQDDWILEWSTISSLTRARDFCGYGNSTPSEHIVDRLDQCMTCGEFLEQFYGNRARAFVTILTEHFSTYESLARTGLMGWEFEDEKFEDHLLQSLHEELQRLLTSNYATEFASQLEFLETSRGWYHSVSEPSVSIQYNPEERSHRKRKR